MKEKIFGLDQVSATVKIKIDTICRAYYILQQTA